MLHIFIHYFLFASKTEALLHFFFSNNRTFTPSFFILSQQSQRTVLFSSISRKKTLTAPSAATKETIYYSGKDEKPGTLGINTKRRTDFLWIVSLRVFSLTGTSGKRVLYIGFIDKFWRIIILHLIKTGIFRIKFPLTRDSW